MWHSSRVRRSTAARRSATGSPRRGRCGSGTPRPAWREAPCRTSCVSGRFSQFVPSRSTRYGIASRRSPSTPMRSQKRMTFDDRLEDVGVVEVEVRLVAEEAMPVELLRLRIPRPVRLLGVGEDDARAGVLVRVVAPHVPVALRRSLRRAARPLEPRVLVGGVVDHQLGDDADVPLVRRVEERPKVLDRAVRRVDLLVRGDVVAVVLERRRIERQQPDRVRAELADVVELLDQSAEVAVAVGVRVAEALDVELVDDRVFVPEGGVVRVHGGVADATSAPPRNGEFAAGNDHEYIYAVEGAPDRASRPLSIEFSREGRGPLCGFDSRSSVDHP